MASAASWRILGEALAPDLVQEPGGRRRVLAGGADPVHRVREVLEVVPEHPEVAPDIGHRVVDLVAHPADERAQRRHLLLDHHPLVGVGELGEGLLGRLGGPDPLGDVGEVEEGQGVLGGVGHRELEAPALEVDEGAGGPVAGAEQTLAGVGDGLAEAEAPDHPHRVGQRRPEEGGGGAVAPHLHGVEVDEDHRLPGVIVEGREGVPLEARRAEAPEVQGVAHRGDDHREGGGHGEGGVAGQRRGHDREAHGGLEHGGGEEPAAGDGAPVAPGEEGADHEGRRRQGHQVAAEEPPGGAGEEALVVGEEGGHRPLGEEEPAAEEHRHRGGAQDQGPGVPGGEAERGAEGHQGTGGQGGAGGGGEEGVPVGLVGGGEAGEQPAGGDPRQGEAEEPHQVGHRAPRPAAEDLEARDQGEGEGDGVEDGEGHGRSRSKDRAGADAVAKTLDSRRSRRVRIRTNPGVPPAPRVRADPGPGDRLAPARSPGRGRGAHHACRRRGRLGQWPNARAPFPPRPPPRPLPSGHRLPLQGRRRGRYPGSPRGPDPRVRHPDARAHRAGGAAPGRARHRPPLLPDRRRLPEGRGLRAGPRPVLRDGLLPALRRGASRGGSPLGLHLQGAPGGPALPADVHRSRHRRERDQGHRRGAGRRHPGLHPGLHRRRERLPRRPPHQPEVDRGPRRVPERPAVQWARHLPGQRRPQSLDGGRHPRRGPVLHLGPLGDLRPGPPRRQARQPPHAHPGRRPGALQGHGPDLRGAELLGPAAPLPAPEAGAGGADAPPERGADPRQDLEAGSGPGALGPSPGPGAGVEQLGGERQPVLHRPPPGRRRPAPPAALPLHLVGGARGLKEPPRGHRVAEVRGHHLPRDPGGDHRPHRPPGVGGHRHRLRRHRRLRGDGQRRGQGEDQWPGRGGEEDPGQDAQRPGAERLRHGEDLLRAPARADHLGGRDERQRPRRPEQALRGPGGGHPGDEREVDRAAAHLRDHRGEPAAARQDRHRGQGGAEQLRGRGPELGGRGHRRPHPLLPPRQGAPARRRPHPAPALPPGARGRERRLDREVHPQRRHPPGAGSGAGLRGHRQQRHRGRHRRRQPPQRQVLPLSHPGPGAPGRADHPAAPEGDRRPRQRHPGRHEGDPDRHPLGLRRVDRPLPDPGGQGRSHRRDEPGPAALPRPPGRLGLLHAHRPRRQRPGELEPGGRRHGEGELGGDHDLRQLLPPRHGPDLRGRAQGLGGHQRRPRAQPAAVPAGALRDPLGAQRRPRRLLRRREHHGRRRDPGPESSWGRWPTR